jgi:hypothetical protein
MLIIRKEQREVLREYMRRAFQERMAAHLRSNFQHNTEHLTQEALLSTIQQGINKATEFGVKLESDLKTFLEYVICFGFSFDTDPSTDWAGSVLRDKSRNASEKMYLLDQLRHSKGEHHE